MRFEAFCPTAKGSPRWWDVSVTPIRSDSTELFAILSVSRDVTAQRQAFESVETMAHEMRHRGSSVLRWPRGNRKSD